MAPIYHFKHFFPRIEPCINNVGKKYILHKWRIGFVDRRPKILTFKTGLWFSKKFKKICFAKLFEDKKYFKFKKNNEILDDLLWQMTVTQTTKKSYGDNGQSISKKWQGTCLVSAFNSEVLKVSNQLDSIYCIFNLVNIHFLFAELNAPFIHFYNKSPFWWFILSNELKKILCNPLILSANQLETLNIFSQYYQYRNIRIDKIVDYCDTSIYGGNKYRFSSNLSMQYVPFNFFEYVCNIHDVNLYTHFGDANRITYVDNKRHGNCNVLKSFIQTIIKDAKPYSISISFKLCDWNNIIVIKYISNKPYISTLPNQNAKTIRHKMVVQEPVWCLTKFIGEHLLSIDSIQFKIRNLNRFKQELFSLKFNLIPVTQVKPILIEDDEPNSIKCWQSLHQN